MKKALKILLILALLLVPLPLIIYFFSSPLKLFPKATSEPDQLSIDQPSTSQSTLINLSEELNPNPGNTIYRSESQGYSFSYDPNAWEVADPPQSQDYLVDNLLLTLRKDLGLASFNLQVFPSSSRDEVLTIQKRRIRKTNYSDLDYLSEYVKSLYTNNYVSSEKVVINGNEGYKFVLKEKILDKESFYDAYLFDQRNRFFLNVLKYSRINNSVDYPKSLLDSLTFFEPGQSSLVKGASAQKEALTKYDAVHIAELVKPSVVNILKLYCDKITLNADDSAVYYLKTSYTFCSGNKGSGLIISKSGQVGTNGHVVKTYPEQAFFENLFSTSLNSFLTDLVKETFYYSKGSVPTEAEIQNFINSTKVNPLVADTIITYVYEMLDKRILTITEESNQLYVKLGNDPFVIDSNKVISGNILDALKPSNSIFKARLVDYNFPNFYSSSVILDHALPTGSDVAILDLENPDNISFPALKLGDGLSVKEGEPLVVIGYPGLVAGESVGNLSIIDYSSSSVKPSITRGIVSSIKKDKGGLNLFQTDASIDKGNSGGPAINEAGEVVGIATYGFTSESGNFNFLRDIEDLRKLMEQNQIDTSENEVFDNWQLGLSNFWTDRYTLSLKSFNLVKKDYPYHPTVDEFISSAQTGINNGQDKNSPYNIDKGFLINALIITILSMSSVILFIALLAQRKKHMLQVPVIPPQQYPNYPQPLPVPPNYN